MALGKGLESLIPKKGKPSGIPAQSPASVGLEGTIIHELDPQKIGVNPHQPRRVFNTGELEDLINSIKIHGIIQPLVVTENTDGTYELIAGERRLRSAKVLGLKTVPAIIREAKEQEKLELALIENLQRKNLNAMEEAYSYERLSNEFDLSQEEIAKRVGKSRSAVANTLRLLDLPQEVKAAIMDEKITEGHARAIAALPSISAQLQLLKKIIDNKLTVRATEGEARKAKGFKSKKIDPVIMGYEEKLRHAFGTGVTIAKKGSKGEIKIAFSSTQDLKDLLDRLLP